MHRVPAGLLAGGEAGGGEELVGVPILPKTGFRGVMGGDITSLIVHFEINVVHVEIDVLLIDELHQVFS